MLCHIILWKIMQNKNSDPGQIIRRFIESGGSLKILLSEDVLVNLRYLEMLFQKLGFSCDIAEDGLKTLELMRRIRYDMVLLDIQMPGLNGEEVLAMLKKEGLLQDTRVIAQTAYSLQGDERKYRDLGCSDYLSKPIDTNKLEKVTAETIIWLDRKKADPT